MEAPAPGQNINSTAPAISDGSRNSQQQQHPHHPQQQLARFEPLEGQRFQSQPPPIQSGGGTPPFHNNRIPVVGQKRDAHGSAAPSNRLPNPNPNPSQDGKSSVKLFVGFVPKTITENELRPIFAEHGNVLEVVLVKHKITGQQRGCCFIRYATIEEADRAINALDNKHTLPGSTGPMSVKYADGELERFGAVENKLFVSNVNTQATEKEIEEIFARYGRVENVYIIRRDGQQQSKGCGFVKYETREMATEAIDALNGTFVMEGCQLPLNVRFADSKKRRIGSDAPYPAFGRQGFGHGPVGARGAGPGRGTRGQLPPTTAQHRMGGQIRGYSPFSNSFQPGNPMTSRWNPIEGTSPGVGGTSGPRAPVHGSAWRPAQMALQRTGPGLSATLSLGQGFNSAHMQSQSRPYVQHPPQIQQQLQEQVQQQKQHQIQPLPYSELHHNSYQSIQHGQPPQTGPVLPSNQQLPVFQPQLHALPFAHTVNCSQQLQITSTHPMQLQPQLPAEHSGNQSVQPSAIQNNFQSQQVRLPLQHQPLLHLQQHCSMQQQNPLPQQQNPLLQQHPTQTMTHPQQKQIALAPSQHKQPQAHLDQSKPVSMPLPMPATNITRPTVADTSVVVGGGPAPTLTCNWTLHASPEGMTYYYNSVTGESKWEKPAELTAYEQQKERPPSQLLQPQAQMQQTHSYPQFQFQPQQLQQPQISQPAIATPGQKPTEPRMFEHQQMQPSQILQPQSQVQQTHSHPQFQPQSQVQQTHPHPQSQVQQTYPHPQSQVQQTHPHPQPQEQQTHSHPQFQPPQQQQSQIVQPSMVKPNTMPAIAPAKVAEPITVTVTTVSDSRAPSHPPLTCDWNEHTSPEGLKYYYNEVTGLSQWDKPAELIAFENQQASRPQP